MVSQAKLIANRNNAQKSTGPRTPEGKARSSRNRSLSPQSSALSPHPTSHYIFLPDIPLPAEKLEEFQAFRKGFLFRFQPACPMALFLVDQIVAAAWRLQRIQQAESVLLCMQTANVNKQSDDNPEGVVPPRYHYGTALALASQSPEEFAPFDRLQRLEHRLHQSINRSLRQLRQLQSLPEGDPDSSPFEDAHFSAIDDHNDSEQQEKFAQNEPTDSGEEAKESQPVVEIDAEDEKPNPTSNPPPSGTVTSVTVSSPASQNLNFTPSPRPLSPSAQNHACPSRQNLPPDHRLSDPLSP